MGGMRRRAFLSFGGMITNRFIRGWVDVVTSYVCLEVAA